MTTRTDDHRPSAIEPEDYEFVGFNHLKWEIGDPGFVTSERARIDAHMQRTGGFYSGHQHGGNCHICGAWAIYTAVFYHEKSNSYIKTGTECADKLGCADASMFRKTVEQDKLVLAGKKKAVAFLSEQGLDRAWQIYSSYGLYPTDDTNEARRVHEMQYTITDIVGKLVKWGSVSEKQVGLIRKLVDLIDNADQIAKQRAEERAAAKPIPTTGRITVRGTVLSLKRVVSDFGPVVKMVVKHADGWTVYGTRPSSLDCEKGQVVEFTAQVEVSRDDPKFGFFRRPTKARVVEEEAPL